MARLRRYKRKTKPGAKKTRKYKRPARQYASRPGAREHRLNWLKDRYAHRGQKYTRGALHRHYRIALGSEIPISKLIHDQHKPGKLGYQVRFALGRRGYYKK